MSKYAKYSEETDEFILSEFKKLRADNPTMSKTKAYREIGKYLELTESQVGNRWYKLMKAQEFGEDVKTHPEFVSNDEKATRNVSKGGKRGKNRNWSDVEKPLTDAQKEAKKNWKECPTDYDKPQSRVDLTFWNSEEPKKTIIKKQEEAMTKTILVIYTNILLPQSSVGTTKRYAFNTDSDVKVGDHISTPAYNTKLQVVGVLDKAHKYYNSVTGELSDTFTSTNQWYVKKLVIRDEESEVIYGTCINKDRENRQ